MSPIAPTSTSVLLRASGVERWLGRDEGRTHALRGVDLVLEPGQAYSVVGPSGCGKSTLLYLLGLLDRPDGGEIWLGEQLMSSASDAERTRARNAHIGFVFQFHFLLPEFSALENVMLPMRKLDVLELPAMRERAADLLDKVGLGNKLHRSTGHLSGGEQQRVAVARALANSPGVILADEPTGNLDAANSQLVFDLLARVAHEMRQAVLIVSHNLDLAARCDRVLRMRDGRFVDER